MFSCALLRPELDKVVANPQTSQIACSVGKLLSVLLCVVSVASVADSVASVASFTGLPVAISLYVKNAF